MSIYSIQLELGSVATPYEPYTDSTLYIADNDELRSVPAISDEVKVVNGKLVKVQNVGVGELGSDVEPTISPNTNITNFVKTDNSNFSFTGAGHLGSTGGNWVETTNLVLNKLYRVSCDITSDGSGNIYVGVNYSPYIGENINGTKHIDVIVVIHDRSDSRCITFGSDLGVDVTVENLSIQPVDMSEGAVKIDSYVITQSQVFYDDANCYYELATPIITPLTTSGNLKAFQNGSVYFEPYYEGSHQTDAYSQITLPYEGTIEAVYGYDEDLVEYLLDSSEYSLTGTTLTITGALENEVFFVQMSRSEPLAPEMSVNVLNNEQVIADTSNGKFYKLVPTITNGSLVSQTPVEVV